MKFLKSKIKTNKLKYFTFFLLVTTLLIGCSDDNVLFEQESINIEKINTVKKIIDRNEQKVAYRLLNDYEKKYLWFEKTDNEIKSKNKFLKKFNNTEYNSIQLELLKEFKNEIVVPIFEDSHDDKKEYIRNIIIPNFINRIKEQFSNREIGVLFYNVNSDYEILMKRDVLTTPPPGEGGGQDVDCECNVGSIVSCTAFSDRCDESDFCKKYNRGCGFLWQWPCNGMCRY